MAPHLWLVEDDEDILEVSPRWWVRGLAAAIVTMFLGTLFFSATMGFSNGSALVPTPGDSRP